MCSFPTFFHNYFFCRSATSLRRGTGRRAQWALPTPRCEQVWAPSEACGGLLSPPALKGRIASQPLLLNLSPILVLFSPLLTLPHSFSLFAGGHAIHRRRHRPGPHREPARNSVAHDHRTLGGGAHEQGVNSEVCGGRAIPDHRPLDGGFGERGTDMTIPHTVLSPLPHPLCRFPL